MDNGNGSNLENVIDRILLSARDLKTKLETVRSYDKHQPIQFENNQKIKELERENKELRQALEDHQYGLEFIMSKYRSQVVKLLELQGDQARTASAAKRQSVDSKCLSLDTNGVSPVGTSALLPSEMNGPC